MRGSPELTRLGAEVRFFNPSDLPLFDDRVDATRPKVRELRTIPNQPSIPKAFQEFDEAGRMRPSPLCDRIVDVMVDLMKIPC